LQTALDELVERHRVGDRRGDEIVLEEEFPFALLAEGDRADRGDPDRVEVTGAFPLVPPLAAAEPLAELSPGSSATRKCLM